LDDPLQRAALPAWPDTDEAALATACTVMARRLAVTPARVIGVLPAAGTMNLGPLLVRLAGALAGFGGARVGVVPRWRTWDKDPGGGAGDVGRLRFRALGADVVAIVPAAARDSRAAALALQEALWSLPEGVGRVLIDLTGYAAPGSLGAGAVIADGVALAVPAGRALRTRVARLLGAIPEAKRLGTILVGGGA
jgi:hypothetical protein